MVPSQQNIFESFNARWLDPRQVAQTFVPPSYYDNLIKRRHTLIAGRRGSGKTTLLKMLQGAALEAWHHPDANEYRRRIDFTGVFVPTDRSWSAQIANVGRSHLEPEHQRLLGVAAFTTHVLRAVIGALEYRTNPPEDPSLNRHRRVQLSRDDESALVKELSSAWLLTPTVPSLLALRYALSERLSSILELSSSERTRGVTNRSERLGTIRYLHLHFIAAAGIAVEIFNSLIRDEGGKWALLFDEMELAPDWIREELIGCLRSTDARFLFKLSLSPFTADRVPTGSSAALDSHDYETIPLWYPYKEQGYDFSRALLSAMLEQQGLGAATAEQVLGTSSFDQPLDGTEGPIAKYAPGSHLQRRFARLARRDHTFRSYLDEHGIDVRKLHALTDEQRAAEVRKVAALVVVREAFRKADNEELQSKARSRKNPVLYRGATSLFAVVEGNPRWLIGILAPLLEEFSKNKEPVHPWRQAAEVGKASSRFRAFLKTIPCPSLWDNQSARGILSALDTIGHYFFAREVLDEFNPDPPATFVVDSTASEELMNSLASALNAGAIVYVPDQRTELVLDSLRGKRFRLTYLLAPHYRLALQLGRPVSLQTILRSEKNDIGSQPQLFNYRDIE